MSLTMYSLANYVEAHNKEIKIMHELPWITMFVSWVRQFANDFHEWQSVADRFTCHPKSIFIVMNVLLYFLHAILCPEHTILLKSNYPSLILHLSLRTAFSDLALWCDHSWSVTSPHRGVLHCDVIFVDYSCMHKLAQRRCSLVNNKCEYWFLTTRYIGLVCKKYRGSPLL